MPDAWHALGPAVVLSLAADVHGVERAGVYVAALAGRLPRRSRSSRPLRESSRSAIAPRLQGRVIALVWLVDACIAPLGLLVAHAARADPVELLLVVPLDRAAAARSTATAATRIEQAQHRLELVARERTRLQAAVQRLGDAFAAKLDLGALTDVLLGGSIDALDADAGG